MCNLKDMYNTRFQGHIQSLGHFSDFSDNFFSGTMSCLAEIWHGAKCKWMFDDGLNI